MARIIFKFKDRVLGVYRLVDEQPFTIGRRPDNHIVIDNLAVSGLHARIDNHAGKYQLTDLESKNGTFLNGESIASCRIKHEDVITIGKHKLVVDLEDSIELDSESPEIAAPGSGGVNLGSDQTMVMNPEQYRNMIRGDLEAEAAPEQSRSKDLELFFLEGGEGSLDPGKGSITIGRNADADVVIGGFWSFLYGAPSATISRSGEKFHLAYAGGLLKPKVNGQTVKGTIQLQVDDTIQVGPVKMLLGYRQNGSN